MNTLSDSQLKAIQQWAGIYGRCWKRELRFAWINGDYGNFELSNELQTIRNTLGPMWLIRFRLPKY